MNSMRIIITFEIIFVDFVTICKTHKQPSHVLLEVRDVQIVLIDREPVHVLWPGGFIERIVASVQLDRLSTIFIRALLPDNVGNFGGHEASDEDTVVDVSQQHLSSWSCEHTCTVPHFNIMKNNATVIFSP